VDSRLMVALKDPQRYATAMLTIDRGAYWILSRCDGKTPFSLLAKDFEEQTGRSFPVDEVRGLLKVFDDNFFFDTPRFHAHRAAVDKAWLDQPVRPATLFDYAEPGREKVAWDELRRILDDYFRDAGFTPGNQIEAAGDDATVLIAPHIDYQRGGKAWAAAYGTFARSFKGRTVIILGTNHQPHKLPVSMTRKDFATPFGLMRVDEDILDEIARPLPFDPFEDELPHRVEHSVELAAVMLAYMRPELNIVPVLVGGAKHLVEGKEDPETDEALLALAEACRDVLDQEGSDVALIASVDLAHLGPMFGDPFPIDKEKGEINKARDLEMLDFLVRGDPEGFVQFVAEERDVRKICGLTPIYVSGTACGLPFELITHDQWIDPKGHGLVSYSALIARRAPTA